MFSTPNSTGQSLTGGTSIAIKPKSKKDLGVEYDLHPKTIAGMCTDIKIDTGGKKLSIAQIMAFYKHYGFPGDYNVNLNIAQA